MLIAHRAAMRVLPEYILARAEELFRAPNERALLALRFNLVCAVFANSDDRELHQKAKILALSEPIVSEFPKLAQSRYPSAFAHAFAAISASACSSADCAADAATALECADVVSKARQLDCRGLEKGENVIANPLWEESNLLVEDWRETKANIVKDKQGWRFWVDWYDKALNGEPQDWPLLTKVIERIPSEDWDKGADHVNALIARIVEQHRLANEARFLKAEIGALRAELELLKHRGHNSPPVVSRRWWKFEGGVISG